MWSTVYVWVVDRRISYENGSIIYSAQHSTKCIYKKKYSLTISSSDTGPILRIKMLVKISTGGPETQNPSKSMKLQ